MANVVPLTLPVGKGCIRGVTDKPDFDAALVKAAFAHVAAHAPQAMEYFCAHLSIPHPVIRAMFPPTMSEHRDRVYGGALLARRSGAVHPSRPDQRAS
jgi:hypothetical protein